MVRLPAFLLAALTSSTMAQAFADTKLVMTEAIQMPDAGVDSVPTAIEFTLWIGEERVARIDETSRMILDVEGGSAWLVDEVKGTYSAFSTSDLIQSVPRNPVISPMGENREIHGWNADGYVVTAEAADGSEVTVTAWVSDESGVDPDGYVQYSSSLDGGEGLLSAIASLDGLPILQELSLGPVSSTIRLIEASEAEPPEGVYKVPEGYIED